MLREPESSDTLVILEMPALSDIHSVLFKVVQLGFGETLYVARA